jgi:hypothetical protein
MSGPLKIQYPDAWYHVGNRGEGVFSLRKDINLFSIGYQRSLSRIRVFKDLNPNQMVTLKLPFLIFSNMRDLGIQVLTRAC